MNSVAQVGQSCISQLLREGQDYICGQANYKWCTYEAIDNYTIIVQQVYAGILIILAGIIFWYLAKLIKLRKSQHSQIFGIVYIQVFTVIISWLICSILRAVLNIAIYYQFMLPDFVDLQRSVSGQIDRELNDPIVIFASIYTFLDFVCSFLINFLIILIPFQWLSILLQSTSQNRLINFNFRKILRNCFTILTAVKVYYKYIRNAYFLLLFLEPLLFFITSFSRCDMPTFNYIWVICQSGLILLFYAFGAFTANYMRKNSLVRIKPKDFRRIRIQYSLLLLCCLFRISLNFYFRLSPFYTYTPNINCSDTIPQNKIKATVFLILHHLFMHILPIAVILFIYRPNVKAATEDNLNPMLNNDDSSLGTLRTKDDGELDYGAIQRQFFRSSLVKSSNDKNASKKINSNINTQDKMDNANSFGFEKD